MPDQIEWPDALRYWQERVRKLSGGGGWLVLVIAIGFWFASGMYTVGPSEVGLVKRFGQFTRQVGPGFQYRLPFPLESVVIVDLRSVRTEEIGFRSRSAAPSSNYARPEEEARMLTGDFNIISLEAVVQYDVTDAETFAFQLEDYRRILREAAQAVIRERVAMRGVDETLTEKREEIAAEIHQELQNLLNHYDTGLRIINVRLQEVTPPTREVAAAFDDVNSAIQDKERVIFEAIRYANEQLPRAEGQSQKILNESQGYKQSRILRAQGDVARFVAVLDRYKLGPEVTETRLYIETMEVILPGLTKIIVPAQGTGLLPWLNLGQFAVPQKGSQP
ncbi:FtsH protease activity modulator HflK [bacterium]|nr:FtsH protease activity modulator HflK [bacterium]